MMKTIISDDEFLLLFSMRFISVIMALFAYWHIFGGIFRNDAMHYRILLIDRVAWTRANVHHKDECTTQKQRSAELVSETAGQTRQRAFASTESAGAAPAANNNLFSGLPSKKKVARVDMRTTKCQINVNITYALRAQIGQKLAEAWDTYNIAAVAV